MIQRFRKTDLRTRTDSRMVSQIGCLHSTQPKGQSDSHGQLLKQAISSLEHLLIQELSGVVQFEMHSIVVSWHISLHSFSKSKSLTK